MDLIAAGFRALLSTSIDVIPIVGFIFAFQLFVIRQRIPNFRRMAGGLVLTVAGLTLFLLGLDQALFPLGRLMAEQLTDPAFMADGSGVTGSGDGSGYLWVFIFALTIGFSTTIAEPALLAVAVKANETSGGAIGVWGLRVAVAIGAAIGVGLGVYRIISGTPLHYFVIAGYVVVVLQTAWAPKLVIPLAYDSGGVTTSTVTVPIVTALGLGLAESIPGRSPLSDGFGMVAVTCLFPIVTVLGYAQISVIMAALRDRRSTAQDPVSMEEN
jgi:hypothetical protein